MIRESGSGLAREATGNRRKTGFGPSVVAECARRRLAGMTIAGDLAEARQIARSRIPVCPGVYGWLNSDGTLIYVGKAKSLRHRLTGYFAARTADPKMARIRQNSSTLVWEAVSHELLALVREQELIDRFRPSWNVQGQPERRQPGFVCLSRGAAPTVFFAGSVTGRAALAVGPIAGRGKLRSAVSSLNHVFRLRDCPDQTRFRFGKQLQLFDEPRVAAGCLRYELTSCPAPCSGACSRETYHANVHQARRFLSGRERSVLNKLETEMKDAAGRLAFERAAVVRDQLRSLTWLDRRIRQLAVARKKLNGVWVLPGFDRQDHWMILNAGRIAGCLAAPGEPETVAGVIGLLEREAERSTTIPQSSLEVNWMLLLGSWIRRQPARAESIMAWDQACEMLNHAAPDRPSGSMCA